MSILSDRRSLREIGGVRAYIRQVGWSLWWRTRSGMDGLAPTPPRLLEKSGASRRRGAGRLPEKSERLAGRRLDGPAA